MMQFKIFNSGKSLLLLTFLILKVSSAHLTAQENTDNIPGNIAWNDLYSDVKERFRVLASNPDIKDPVEIILDEPEKEILVRRKGIYYRYLFYQKPISEEDVQQQDQQGQNATTDENQEQVQANKTTDISKQARLFFIETSFLFVQSEKLYEKLKMKYGSHTNEHGDIKKQKSGAYIWDSEKSYLVQWIEPYQEKSFTRKIYNISKDIRKEIMEDLESFQYRQEIETINNILP